MANLTKNRVWFCAVLLMGVFVAGRPPAAAAAAEAIEPIAQVYSLKGNVSLRQSGDGSTVAVSRGALVGSEDLIILERGAAVGLYFKNGGRKELEAGKRQEFRVTDLVPQTHAYGQSVPVFGATRGIGAPAAGGVPVSFFYPQETVVVDRVPVIALKAFNACGESLSLRSAEILILKDGERLGAQTFGPIVFGTPYPYRLPDLAGGAEYTVEIVFDAKELFGNDITITFPLYVCAAFDQAASARFKPFALSLYRSFETTIAEAKGRKFALWLTKSRMPDDVAEPFISIEFFITHAP